MHRLLRKGLWGAEDVWGKKRTRENYGLTAVSVASSPELVLEARPYATFHA